MSDREADSEVRVFSVHLGSLHSELALRSIANVDKSGKIEMETPSYFEKYSRQTFYAAAEVVKGFDGRSYTEMKPSAVGPFPQCLRVFQRSVKGVFFGNLRAKATIEHEKQKTSFRLGMMIHHLQLTDISDLHVPDLQTKTSDTLIAPFAQPSDSMMGLI
ncbi:hypothetical protein SeMB42_g04386 [Synchytrium endobioticum]|uniref:Uncharacterized protein n=1 Tax=Synchytrium endobioticum TaxID=286115 RepID=A0A507CYK9_9FUNG|nr:hypothetical protein SeMB42_g04386 [Synchytrium endobioticum]